MDTVATRLAPASYWLEGFGRCASEEVLPDELEQIHAWYQALLGPYVRKDAELVLDIGCGRGRVMRAIAALAPGCCCVGIDGNEATLAAAHEALAHQPVRVALHRMDIMQEGFGQMLAARYGCFDAITSMFVLHHYTPAMGGAILGELRGLLAPNGVIVLAEAHDPSNLEAACAERVCAELAALAGEHPDLLWTETELLEACGLGGFGAEETGLETAPGSPFTPAERAANLQALDRVEACLAAAEAKLAHTAGAHPLAALRRVVSKMRAHGIARPVRFGPLLAILHAPATAPDHRRNSCR